MTTPRGIRNNNPGNIKHGDKWQGLATKQTDQSFCTFETAEYGIRALTVLLKTYYNQYNLKTVSSIIRRYAPPQENNTHNYIQQVARSLDIDEDEIITLDTETLEVLIKAIIKHENGISPYSNEQILKGIDMS